MQAGPRRSTGSLPNGTIDDPEIGLKAQIKEAEESWLSCVKNQKTVTSERND